MNRAKVLITFSMVLACGAILGATLVYRSLSQPVVIGDELVYEVRPGQPFGAVATELHQWEIIKQPQAWKVYALLTGEASKIQAGEYVLRGELSALEILGIFTRGAVKQHAYTLVEGWTFSQVLSDLQSQNKLQVQTSGLSAADIMAQLGAPGDHPEGQFFADTYYFTAGTTDLAILARAREQLQQVLAEEWAARAVGLPYNGAEEALVMASIIEKETAVPAERGQIAGVFVRRLHNNMRLQTDPTVIYGLGDAYDGDLRRSDLKSDSPYNTYVHKGLPPTPIAMVGRSAIHAALHPKEGDSLYFVAKGDGSHFFSATLDQHNRAVQEYQRSNRAKDYRSTPNSQHE